MRAILEADLPHLSRRLFRRDLDALALDLEGVLASAMIGVARRLEGALRELCEQAEACLGLCRRLGEERALAAARFAALQEGLAAADTDTRRRELMLELLASMSPPEAERGDREALERDLGLDAVTERYLRLQDTRARREEILVIALTGNVRRVVKNLLHQAAAETGDTRDVRAQALASALAILRDLQVETALVAQIERSPRWQNRVAGLRCLGRLADALPLSERGHAVSASTRALALRLGLDRDENIWVQRQALELLRRIAPVDALQVIENRLLHESAAQLPDDIFVRAHAARLLVVVAEERRALASLRRALERPEPSELVRMELMRSLATLSGLDAERLLLRAVRGDRRFREQSPRVRALVATLWRQKAQSGRSHEEIAARTLAWLIQHDEDLITRRVAVEEAAALAEDRQMRQRRYKVDAIDFVLLEALDAVIRSDRDVRMKRVCQEAREAIVLRTYAAYDWVESRLARALDELDEHGQLELPVRAMPLPEDLLGRLLAHHTRRTFGVVVERRGDTYILRKGDRFGRRLWRILHELRNPDAAKRQAHRHTIGRVYRGHLRAHPGLLAELVETKVPGERLWNGQELSWRRFLPTVDDYLSTFSWLPWRRQRRILVFSSEGVTEIRDRRSWWRALRDHLALSWRYKELAQMRNGGPNDRRHSDRSAFLRVMRDRFALETLFTRHELRYEGQVYRAHDATLAEHFRHGAYPESLALRAREDIPTAELRRTDGNPLDAPAATQSGAHPAGDDAAADAGIGRTLAGEPETGGAFDEGASERTLDHLLRPLLAEAGTAEITLAGAGSAPDLNEITDDAYDHEELDQLLGPAGRTPARALAPDETHPELVLGAAGWQGDTAEQGDTADAHAPPPERSARDGASRSPRKALEDTADEPLRDRYATDPAETGEEPALTGEETGPIEPGRSASAEAGAWSAASAEAVRARLRDGESAGVLPVPAEVASSDGAYDDTGPSPADDTGPRFDDGEDTAATDDDTGARAYEDGDDTAATGAASAGLAVIAPWPIGLSDLMARGVRLFDEHRDLAYLYWESASTPAHLFVVLLVFLVLFLGRQILATRRIVRARASVPLVIGGWGTRGKSGVERKKSALFAALGCDVVTKTTGCEAMFIHAQPGVKPLELFIYRPYDKATIWEQRDLIELASDMGAHVFLYECMALNPQYVRLIQHGWMRDDISTITNAYPDHEDIQGPAGVDLPYVIGEFIPSETTCFTAEDTMLPILESVARKRGTTLDAIGWRDAALLPQDVLARYPYNVHPLNLALVTRMAEHLGVERDFAWKEIADHIIPDLGVLKVFPVAEHRGRKLEFSNGHSANERHGFNANWSRLGLGDLDPVAEADRWIVTVVNNRGDRIARSKVFADALTQDVRCHGHFLIGTNLQGLAGYMHHALESRLANVTVRPPESEGRSAGLATHACARLDRELRDFCYETPALEHVHKKLLAMLAGLGLDAALAQQIASDSALTEATRKTALRSVEIDPLLPEGASPGRDPAFAAALRATESAIVDAGVPDAIAADVAAWFERYVRERNSVEALRAHLERALEGAPGPAAVADADTKLRSLLRRFFMRRVVPIWDAGISGDGIVDHVARHLPPGLHVHIHGCQNIKGPGLDWVYRWVNLGQVERACQRLEGRTEAERLEGLIGLATNNDYGLLDAPRALAAIRAARDRPQNQSMAFQTQAALALEHVEARLCKAREAVEAQSVQQQAAWSRAIGGVVERFTKVIEGALDPGDAVWRRREAERIKRDLVHGRIGHDRAALKLRELMKRQKGGWLLKSIRTRLQALRRSVGLPDVRPRTAGERD